MTAPPRVAFFTESFHPVLGGGETHIRALGGALVRAGWQALVVTRQSDPTSAARDEVDGMRVIRVPPAGPGRTGKYRMVAAACAALESERAAFDLLVVRGTRVLGPPGLATGRRLGKPVVLQPEVNGEFSGEIFWWGTPLATPPLRQLVTAAKRWQRRGLREADAFVAMSHAIRDEIHEAGVSGERIHLLPHGVDTERFRPASASERAELRGRLGLPAGPLVCFTGRLLKGKGLESLVEAFARAGAPRGAHLAIVGSGSGQALSIEEALRARVQGAGLANRVTFAGRVDAVEDWLRAADVFAFPSEFEALGLSLIEAAACGLACIGARTGGIPDVIADGESGLLVPPRDSVRLAAAIAALLDDPARRAALGAAARAHAVLEFSFAHSVERYRELFVRLAGRAA